MATECGRGWSNRCRHAKSKKCRCRCGGSNHGSLAEPDDRGDLFDPEGPPFVLELPTEPKVGAIYRLRLPCLGEEIGALGVCYEVYQLYEDGKHRPGYSFIFQGGGYDGFSPTHVEQFLEPIGFSPALAGYRFTNVMRLAQDYRRGAFTPAFKTAGKALVQEAIDFLNGRGTAVRS